MKYYVVSDIHSYYDPLIHVLTKHGFFTDTLAHKLIICGDLFDRGKQAKQLQTFILELMEKDEVILIKGNHEDLLLDLINHWNNNLWTAPYNITNGTTSTIMQLTDTTYDDLDVNTNQVLAKLLKTPTLQRIIPSMVNYFETQNYIFVHGWIPCHTSKYGLNTNHYTYDPNWRNANKFQWDQARWINGMDAWANLVKENDKTIVCGHWHASYGHKHFHANGDEFGDTAQFSPFIDKGIIALDACCAYSNTINCIVINDNNC